VELSRPGSAKVFVLADTRGKNSFKSIIGASAIDAEWLHGQLNVRDTVTL
jgi:hypothetical protein